MPTPACSAPGGEPVIFRHLQTLADASPTRALVPLRSCTPGGEPHALLRTCPVDGRGCHSGRQQAASQPASLPACLPAVYPAWLLLFMLRQVRISFRFPLHSTL